MTNQVLLNNKFKSQQFVPPTNVVMMTNLYSFLFMFIFMYCFMYIVTNQRYIFFFIWSIYDMNNSTSEQSYDCSLLK